MQRDPDRRATGRPTRGREGGSSEGGIDIEILAAENADRLPRVEPGTRVDVAVVGTMYPTAKLADDRYISWWFDALAPDPDSPAVSEWIAAPTRFLAAVTMEQLREDPATLSSLLASADGEPAGEESID